MLRSPVGRRERRKLLWIHRPGLLRRYGSVGSTVQDHEGRHLFCSVPVRSDLWGDPYSTAVQHTNGNVYGATYEGGVGNGGGFYRLALGLKPLVLLLPPGHCRTDRANPRYRTHRDYQREIRHWFGELFCISDTYLQPLCPMPEQPDS